MLFDNILEGSESSLRLDLDRGSHDLSTTKSEIRREEGAFEDKYDSCRVVTA
jgi:hypothetical protein